MDASHQTLSIKPDGNIKKEKINENCIFIILPGSLNHGQIGLLLKLQPHGIEAVVILSEGI